MVRVVGQPERLVVQGQLADQRVVRDLTTRVLVLDVVVGPPAAEVLALDGQLPDERGELRVVGVLPGLHPQEGLAAEDVADLVAYVADLVAYVAGRPRNVNLRQIVVLPTRQA